MYVHANHVLVQAREMERLGRYVLVFRLYDHVDKAGSGASDNLGSQYLCDPSERSKGMARVLLTVSYILGEEESHIP